MYRTDLSQDEAISLRHRRHYLSTFDWVIIAPEGLTLSFEGARVERFPSENFTSVAAYSRLMLSRELYERFAGYEYILIYQLDCLVFASGLEQWCGLDVDYLGAPWLRPAGRAGAIGGRVGNGGFSLRRVSAFLRVLDPCRQTVASGSLLSTWLSTELEPEAGPNWIARTRKKAEVFRDVRRGIDWYVANYTLNEDRFWSDRARLFDPRFKIATGETGLRFAFEEEPRLCFESTGSLPFGCHAWAKYDRKFWEPFLLS